MPGDDDVVRGVGSNCCVKGSENPSAGFEPAVPEALVCSAEGADVCRDLGEVGVGEKVLDGLAAAEGEDN